MDFVTVAIVCAIVHADSFNKSIDFSLVQIVLFFVLITTASSSRTITCENKPETKHTISTRQCQTSKVGK